MKQEDQKIRRIFLDFAAEPTRTGRDGFACRPQKYLLIF